MSENTVDRKDLKIQALLEKISSLTTSYENTIADLRVELTLVNSNNEDLQNKINALKESDVLEEKEDASDNKDKN